MGGEGQMSRRGGEMEGRVRGEVVTCRTRSDFSCYNSGERKG